MRPNIPPRRLAPACLALLAGFGLLLGAPPHAAAQDADRIEHLRATALSLVNAARIEAGRPPLMPVKALADAAQSHAEDMLARDYYSHRSPEGASPRDRHLAQGGSRTQRIAENIAHCDGCAAPATLAEVLRLHEGWMDSPAHRDNLLAPGLDSFGFGIAADGRALYAVQTFAGGGARQGIRPAGAPDSLP